MKCEHNYQYRGAVYKLGPQDAGSSTRLVLYYDCYYCSRCLAVQYKKLNDSHDSYQKIRYDAKPMAEQGYDPRGWDR